MLTSRSQRHEERQSCLYHDRFIPSPANSVCDRKRILSNLRQDMFTFEVNVIKNTRCVWFKTCSHSEIVFLCVSRRVHISLQTQCVNKNSNHILRRHVHILCQCHQKRLPCLCQYIFTSKQLGMKTAVMFASRHVHSLSQCERKQL